MMVKETEVTLRGELVIPKGELIAEIGFILSYELGEFGRSIIDRLLSEVEITNEFTNSRGTPITTLIKKKIQKFAKEENYELNNDKLANAINRIRSFYEEYGTLTFMELKGDEALLEIGKHGDSNSCFNNGSSNSAHPVWLLDRDDMSLVIVDYTKGNIQIGTGRFWLWRSKTSKAAMGFNFYSKGFDVKAKRWKYPVVRGIRNLLEIESCLFTTNVTGFYTPPIYWNQDEILVWDNNAYESSREALKDFNCYGKCMECNRILHFSALSHNTDLDGGSVGIGEKWWDLYGLIVCPDCDRRVIGRCVNCDELVTENDYYYISPRGDLFCDPCFNDLFVICDECEEAVMVEDSIYTEDGFNICLRCSEYLFYCAICNSPYRNSDQLTTIWYFNSEMYSDYELRCNNCSNGINLLECGNCGALIDIDTIPNELAEIECPNCGVTLELIDEENKEAVTCG